MISVALYWSICILKIIGNISEPRFNDGNRINQYLGMIGSYRELLYRNRYRRFRIFRISVTWKKMKLSPDFFVSGRFFNTIPNLSKERKKELKNLKAETINKPSDYQTSLHIAEFKKFLLTKSLPSASEFIIPQQQHLWQHLI